MDSTSLAAVAERLCARCSLESAVSGLDNVDSRDTPFGANTQNMASWLGDFWRMRARDFLDNASYLPYTFDPCGPLAQWLEQTTHNRLVPRSIRGGATNLALVFFLLPERGYAPPALSRNNVGRPGSNEGHIISQL